MARTYRKDKYKKESKENKINRKRYNKIKRQRTKKQIKSSLYDTESENKIEYYLTKNKENTNEH